MRFSLVAVVVGSLAAMGCDTSTEPLLNRVRVHVTTTGDDIDARGYVVVVDEQPGLRVSIPANGSYSVNLSLGEHSVRLVSLPGNCSSSEPLTQIVQVRAGAPVDVSFGVTCVFYTGVLRVVTMTTGQDLDGNGYVVVVDGDRQQPLPIASSGTILTPRLRMGNHTVELIDVARNCALENGGGRLVSIAAGATVEETFAFACTAFARLRVVTSTTGTDMDADGYTIRLTATDLDRTVDIGVNDELVVGDLLAEAHEITVNGISLNCDVAGPSTRSVTLVSATTVEVSVSASCVQATQLAYTASSNGNDDIFVVKSNGVGATRLTTSPGADLDANWSPDGSMIVFASTRNFDQDIYVMSANGANLKQITSAPGSDRSPVWSPDGSKIAFVSQRTGNAAIYVMNADGSNPVTLTPSAASSEDPAWSPDGTKIAFVSRRDVASEVYVMNADGSNAVRLTTNEVNDSRPAWSPDGTRIALAREIPCDDNYYYYYFCRRNIVVMNADGSGAKQLDSPTDDFDPVWSPDGSRIAFVRIDCGYYDCAFVGLVATKQDGTDPRVIVDGWVFRPSWRR